MSPARSIPPGRRPRWGRAGALSLLVASLGAALAACHGSAHPGAGASPTALGQGGSPLAPASASASAGPSAASSPLARSTPKAHAAAPARTPMSPSASGSSPATSPPNASITPAPGAPVIVLDPGHSVTITATDPATGLQTSDYENEPEMRDVFAVALLVQTALRNAGYRVVMTKTSVDEPMSLGERATIADDAHAALALSIHDQAGSDGGIPFATGNNIVYYQSVGDYRETSSGTKVVFDDAALAATSKRYGQIFQAQRAAVEGHAVSLLGDTGYDLASRGLPAGDIWTVQLLSHVPWIYNEAGGNSPGMSGLDPADEQRYADGLVAAVEHCIPPPR